MSKVFNSALPLDYTPRGKKKQEEEVKLDFTPCLQCKKAISDGYYARYGKGGVCSKTCMKKQEQEPKFGEHTEEAFLAKFNL